MASIPRPLSVALSDAEFDDLGGQAAAQTLSEEPKDDHAFVEDTTGHVSPSVYKLSFAAANDGPSFQQQDDLDLIIDALATPAASSPGTLSDIPVLAPSPRRPISLRDGSTSPRGRTWSPRVEKMCDDDDNFLQAPSPTPVASARSSRPVSVAGTEQYDFDAPPSRSPSANPDLIEDTTGFEDDPVGRLVDYEQDAYEEPAPHYLHAPVEEVQPVATPVPSPAPEPKFSSKKKGGASKKGKK